MHFFIIITYVDFWSTTLRGFSIFGIQDHLTTSLVVDVSGLIRHPLGIGPVVMVIISEKREKKEND